jgi:hypothetical protein
MTLVLGTHGKIHFWRMIKIPSNGTDIHIRVNSQKPTIFQHAVYGTGRLAKDLCCLRLRTAFAVPL